MRKCVVVVVLTALVLWVALGAYLTLFGEPLSPLDKLVQEQAARQLEILETPGPACPLVTTGDAIASSTPGPTRIMLNDVLSGPCPDNYTPTPISNGVLKLGYDAPEQVIAINPDTRHVELNSGQWMILPLDEWNELQAELEQCRQAKETQK